MRKKFFTLIPFTDKSINSQLKIQGNIARQQNMLTVVYQLVGDLNKIVIPVASNPPTRQHELWQNTCFELFLGLKDSPEYWEVNLSPGGDWNIYRFGDYRQGMTEAEEFNSLPFFVEKRSPTFQLQLALDLSPIIVAEQDLAIGVTAVIKFKPNLLTYWALTHPATEADFHHRDSFVIYL